MRDTTKDDVGQGNACELKDDLLRAHAPHFVPDDHVPYANAMAGNVRSAAADARRKAFRKCLTYPAAGYVFKLARRATVLGEFGRTPKIQPHNPSRGHWAEAGCAVLYAGDSWLF